MKKKAIRKLVHSNFKATPRKARKHLIELIIDLYATQAKMKKDGSGYATQKGRVREYIKRDLLRYTYKPEVFVEDFVDASVIRFSSAFSSF